MLFNCEVQEFELYISSWVTAWKKKKFVVKKQESALHTDKNCIPLYKPVNISVRIVPPTTKCMHSFAHLPIKTFKTQVCFSSCETSWCVAFIIEHFNTSWCQSNLCLTFTVSTFLSRVTQRFMWAIAITLPPSLSILVVNISHFDVCEVLYLVSVKKWLPWVILILEATKLLEPKMHE